MANKVKELEESLGEILSMHNTDSLLMCVTRWIMFPHSRITVKVAHNLEFRVHIPLHGNCQPAYMAFCEAYLQSCRAAVPPIRELGLHTQAASVETSVMTMPSEGPFYYHVPDSEFGRSNSGRVFQVRDASTGTFYAAKDYFGKFPWQDARTGQMLTAVHHVRV